MLSQIDRQAFVVSRAFRTLVSLWMSVMVLSLLGARPAAAQGKGTTPPLAVVEGEAITAAEVDKALGDSLRKLEEQIYDLRRQKLEGLIGERLLAREAAKRGLTLQALLEAEVTAKVEPVTDPEVEAFYQARKAQFVRRDETALRAQIRTYLLEQKLGARREAFIQSLRSPARVMVNLQTPPVTRAKVAVDGAPFRGPAEAPVTLVEFSDFHCPFCRRVLPTLNQILERYGDRVKLVFRDFPIDSLHPQARKAAEAARCAHDQGKFWPYHDVLFANAPKASPQQLTAYAERVGLDLARFEQCLSSGVHQAAVQKDVEEAIRLGATGTPAFFINGRRLSGAEPLETFVRVIESELAQVSSAGAGGQKAAR